MRPAAPELRSRPAGAAAATYRGAATGVGRSTSDAAEAVSDDLRRHAGRFLDKRRTVARLSLTAIGALGAVATYQYGLIRHLPEPPGEFFDADRVDASGEAYAYLRTPDAALGLASYAVTLALAGAGPAERARTHPWLPLLLAGKVAIDAGYGGYLTAEQLSRHRKLCSWCLVAAGSSMAMLPWALPEARTGLRSLTSSLRAHRRRNAHR